MVGVYEVRDTFRMGVWNDILKLRCSFMEKVRFGVGREDKIFLA